MEKRYYWFKLYADFFESKRIKKLRKQKRGDTMLAIYLKMQLKSLSTGGVLEYSGIEDSFAEELALDLSERTDDVRNTLAFLLDHGLCICDDGTHYVLPWVEENTGSETAATQRWRDWKKRHDVGEVLETNKTPTDCQRTANAEKEIDIEIDKREYKEKRKRKRNMALNYPQTEINPKDFEAMIVNLDKEDA